MNGRVVAFVDDIIFAAKIRGTAEPLGVKVEFLKNPDMLFQGAAEEIPATIIFDLHSARHDPFALAERLKADERLRAVPLVGFFSHVQTELLSRARNAGFDHVFPRSAFTKNLAGILQGDF